jgi:iron(II)-dependent oxidoreductase
MAILELLRQATASMWPTSEPIDEEQEDKVRLAADEPRTDLRYCVELDKQCEEAVSVGQLSALWKSLERDMALTPAGEVCLAISSPVRREGRFEFASSVSNPLQVEPFYVDRCAVTNAEYWAFVESGAYANVDIWPPEILPFVLQCIDRTGLPGPKYWEEGRPLSQLMNHPVVGISWCEATAYAKWVGKRLLTPAEWQRSGTWPAGEGPESRYPWGNTFRRDRVHIRTANHAETAPVNDYVQGCTPNGVYQLIGNTWEWLANEFHFDSGSESLVIAFDQPMDEIRGAAFDTYFETQATCQFRTGKAKLARVNNVGFRCGVSVSQLQQPPTAFDLLDEDLADS